MWLYAGLQATLHNAHFFCQCSACRRKGEMNREVHHDPYTPEDFMPGRKKREQTTEEKVAQFQMFVEAMGGTKQEPGKGTMEERLAAARAKFKQTRQVM